MAAGGIAAARKWDEYRRGKIEGEPVDEKPKKKRRPGTCPNCGHGSFTLTAGNRQLYRRCKRPGCDYIDNPETGEIINKGMNV